MIMSMMMMMMMTKNKKFKFLSCQCVEKKLNNEKNSYSIEQPTNLKVVFFWTKSEEFKKKMSRYVLFFFFHSGRSFIHSFAIWEKKQSDNITMSVSMVIYHVYVLCILSRCVCVCVWLVVLSWIYFFLSIRWIATR